MAFFEKHRENNSQILYICGDSSFPAHFHKNVEILYALENGLTAVVDNEKFNLNANQMLFIDAYSVHQIIGKQNSLTVCVPIKYLGDWLDFKGERRIEKIVFNDDGLTFYKILSDFADLEKENFLIKKAKIDYLFGKIAERAVWTKKAAKGDEMVLKAIDYLNENYDKDLNLESVALAIGYGKWTLSHNFKRKTGLDVREYLTHVRLNELVAEKQRALNAGENKKLIDLIMQVGFDSTTTFYRCFKKRFGVSPKVYFNEEK